MDNSYIISFYQNHQYFKDAINFLNENYHNKENEFLKYFVQSEQYTLNIFITLSLKYRIINYENNLIPNQENKLKIINPKFSNEETSFSNYLISLAVKDIYAFDILTLKSNLLNCLKTDHWEHGQTFIIDNCIKLLDFLENNPQLEVKKFRSDLIHSIINMALVYTINKEYLNSICQFGVENQKKYISDYVDHKLHLDSLFDKYVFYGQLHWIGFHMHTNSKNRIGFSCEDMVKYSNEFRNIILIRIIGLHKSVGRFKFIDENIDPTEYCFKQYPNIQQPILKYLKDHNLNINDYIIYPMYPYSVEKVLSSDQFQTEVSEQLLILFDETINIPSYATESIRSVAPKVGYQIKFSVPIRLTSYNRLFPITQIDIGISVSNIIEHILQCEDSFSSEKIIILKEVGGIYHYNGDSKNEKYQIFSTVFKESVNTYLKFKEDQPIPSCVLFNKSPIYENGDNSTTILGELIHQYHEFFGIPNGKSFVQSIISWYNKYCQLLLHPTLILLTKYGVSLESHLQNFIVIYNKGEPRTGVLKDWSSTDIKMERLKIHQNKIPISIINSFPDIDDFEFYDVFKNSVLHNNIGQIILLICKEFNGFGICERELWNITYEIMKSIFDSMKKDCNPILLKQIKEDEEIFFNSTLSIQSIFLYTLLKDKSNLKTSERIYNNPLISQI